MAKDLETSNQKRTAIKNKTESLKAQLAHKEQQLADKIQLYNKSKT